MVDFYGDKSVISLTLLTLIFSLGAATLTSFAILPLSAYIYLLLFLSLASIFCIVSYKEFTCGFLLSLFCMMIGWRIAAIYSIEIITYPLFIAFILFLSNFIVCAAKNIMHPENYRHAVSEAEWQLIFVRLYIGLNFVPHFTEKLFAGSGPFLADVNAFVSLGVPHPELFVILAGLCELGAAIALCLGFIMRLGSFGAVLYLAIATYLGHHFSLGFIWAGTGGGWEFATFWMLLIFSFCVTGSHSFSIDQQLEDKFSVPPFIKKLL